MLPLDFGFPNTPSAQRWTFGRRFQLLDLAFDLFRGLAFTLPLTTVGFDMPVRRMISTVPRPSAVASTISARQTSLRGVLRLVSRA